MSNVWERRLKLNIISARAKSWHNNKTIGNMLVNINVCFDLKSKTMRVPGALK